MQSKIKFTDLYQLISDKTAVVSKVVSLIKSSSFIGGKEVSNFEKKIFLNLLKLKNV